MRGGNLLGKGGFGNVYDDINDIFAEIDIEEHEITPNMIHMYTKEESSKRSSSKSSNSNSLSKSTNTTSSSNKRLINKSMVFKYLFETDKISEEDNNNIVWNIVQPSLTSLHKCVKSIDIPTINTILVFSKFDCNLEEFLYEKKDSGEAWKKKPFNLLNSNDFIMKVMSQLLKFCKCIHEHKFVHYDVKLDNILMKENGNKIVLADYGLLQNINSIKEFQDDPDEHFMGMINYMPPFCQYIGNKNDVLVDYSKRMNTLFNSKHSRHPQVWIPENEKKDFFKQIAESYKIKGVIDQSNKFKIDLHPIGIILLQLLFYFQDDRKNQENDFMKWYGIAKDLLLNNNKTAEYILEKIETSKNQLGGREKKKIYCAGRLRVIYYKDKKQFVNINRKLITVKEAKLLKTI